MQITQEAANLIDTLAGAASKIGSTAASAKINQVIVELLPPSQVSELEAMVTQLQGSVVALTDANAQLTIDANAYRISNDIRGENLEALRGKLAQITQIATQSVAESASAVTEELVNSLADDFRQIITLAEPNEDVPIDA